MINTHVKVFTLLASGARFHPLGFISHRVHVVSQCFHNDVLALGTTRYLCKLPRQGMPFPAGISPWARRVPSTREVLLAPGKLAKREPSGRCIYWLLPINHDDRQSERPSKDKLILVRERHP